MSRIQRIGLLFCFFAASACSSHSGLVPPSTSTASQHVRQSGRHALDSANAKFVDAAVLYFAPSGTPAPFSLFATICNLTYAGNDGGEGDREGDARLRKMRDDYRNGRQVQRHHNDDGGPRLIYVPTQDTTFNGFGPFSLTLSCSFGEDRHDESDTRSKRDRGWGNEDGVTLSIPTPPPGDVPAVVAYDLSDPNLSGTIIDVAPATVSGNTYSFAASSAPATFKAFHWYAFTMSFVPEPGLPICSNAAPGTKQNNAGLLGSTGALSFIQLGAGANPYAIASGPNGLMYVSERACNRIASIDPATGKVKEYAIPTANAQPGGLVQGPDGNLWFTESGAAQVAKMTSDGTITEYKLPTGYTSDFITSAPDGNLYASGNNAAGLAMLRITTAGVSTAYPIPSLCMGSSFPPVPRILGVADAVTTSWDGNVYMLTGNYCSVLGFSPASNTFTNYQGALLGAGSLVSKSAGGVIAGQQSLGVKVEFTDIVSGQGQLWGVDSSNKAQVFAPLATEPSQTLHDLIATPDGSALYYTKDGTSGTAGIYGHKRGPSSDVSGTCTLYNYPVADPQFNTPAPGAGGATGPTHVALGPDKNVYAVEPNNDKVVRLNTASGPAVSCP